MNRRFRIDFRALMVIAVFGSNIATAQTVQISPAASPTPTTSTLAVVPTPGKWQLIWIDRVEVFRAENAKLDPDRRYIVFLGDSLTQGFKLDEFFPGLPVLNRGIVSDGSCDFPSGKNIWRGITRRMKESVLDCRPSHLFLLIGTNDVGVTSIPLDYWFGSYQFILQETKKAFPDVKIILVTCPPSGPPYARVETLNPRIVEWNAKIRELATRDGYRLIDLYALLASPEGILPSDLTRDGLHFNKSGYERWAAKVREILQQDGVTN